MKRILKSKKGVSLLEGLIALLLLALVATGTFGVLLSVSRKSSTPDIREEMILAIEKANQMLQPYMYPDTIDASEEFEANDYYEEMLDKDLCGFDGSAIELGSHDIESCLLPPICDPDNSLFTYKVATDNNSARSLLKDVDLAKKEDDSTASDVQDNMRYVIQFEIMCNGFTL
ncbi:MAG: hypothetical protein IKJ44_02315 [Elusimicrobiaceae bacterium]|nr:hypothetical protein [Elusimicrobiaceae bacterium]